MSAIYPRVTDQLSQTRNCALDLFVGDCIGEGSSRSVYELEREPDKVLKVEYAGGTFHNIMEWKIWQAVRDTPINDWFAECYEIDSWGTALIQRRADIFSSEREFEQALQERRGGVLPQFLCDIRYNNFGLIAENVVCVDYGITAVFETITQITLQEFGYVVSGPAEITPPAPRQLALNL